MFVDRQLQEHRNGHIGIAFGRIQFDHYIQIIAVEPKRRTSISPYVVRSPTARKRIFAARSLIAV
jgi:hypothetical protein